MSPDLRPIETVYQGFRFRSRTEARWAVTFEVAGLTWQYEREGFDLPSGWYLPDFWIAGGVSMSPPMWVEVKGQDPTPREIALAQELARASRTCVAFAVGQPDHAKHYTFPVYDGENEIEVVTHLPRHAFDAARAARFDGKPAAPAASSGRTPFGRHRFW